MVSIYFGITPARTHHESVAYDHKCGGVQPGDNFSKDWSKVDCEHCLDLLEDGISEDNFEQDLGA